MTKKIERNYLIPHQNGAPLLLESKAISPDVRGYEDIARRIVKAARRQNEEYFQQYRDEEILAMYTHTETAMFLTQDRKDNLPSGLRLGPNSIGLDTDKLIESTLEKAREYEVFEGMQDEEIMERYIPQVILFAFIGRNMNEFEEFTLVFVP